VFEEAAVRWAANGTGDARRKVVVNLRDTMIAGIVLAHHASLATGKVAT